MGCSLGGMWFGNFAMVGLANWYGTKLSTSGIGTTGGDVIFVSKVAIHTRYTGMDRTRFGHQLWEFICEGLTHSVHVTSNVITYHCSACRRRGTIERRLTLLRNA